jgi:hypothetical protein
MPEGAGGFGASIVMAAIPAIEYELDGGALNEVSQAIEHPAAVGLVGFHEVVGAAPTTINARQLNEATANHATRLGRGIAACSMMI